MNIKNIFKGIVNVFYLELNKKQLNRHHDGRSSGKTTRILDKCVQDLFTNGVCDFSDHYGTRQSDFILFHKLIGRLHREHHIEFKDLKVYRSINTIKFKDFKKHEYKNY